MAVVQNAHCLAKLKAAAADIEAVEDKAGYRLPDGLLNAVDYRRGGVANGGPGALPWCLCSGRLPATPAAAHALTPLTPPPHTPPPQGH